MSEWTPEELRAVLRSGDRVQLKKLAAYLLEAAEVGHFNFLYGKPGLCRGAQRTMDDDVQDTLMTLFKDGARLLLKFGDRPDFRPSPDALKRFVIGITWNVLQKRYQDRGRWWEQLEHDLRSFDEYPRLHQLLDLDKARSALSPKDQELFELLYVEQRDPAEICLLRGIQRNALDAQKSRLLKRLLEFMRREPGASRRKDGDD
ncbi:RNA polymerase sigma factor [Nannocystis pusilla]|uniref:RNA polymerase sigma factor n=1 Tax=Nannocystis pusilla TaxID=889268 RepID=UPI003BF358D8